ncbi:MAG TPA: hypothetical protein VIZ00_10790 [Streptosporangiaceae bacterium]
MQLRAGLQLESVVSPARVIVIRAQKDDVEVCCGGSAMVTVTGTTANVTSPSASEGGGPVLGKRYAHEELGLEFLCTRAGAGELTVNGEPLTLKEPKPLPSSD